MDKTKSSTAEKSDGTAKIEQASAHSKDSVPHRPINMQMVQNVLLIWLDNNIDNKSDDCRNTIVQLRRTVNTINTFTDAEECVQFLENMHNDKACMIISGSLGERIVPRVHNLPPVDSIFILSDNKSYHKQWTKEWPKIKGIFTEMSPICEALKMAARQCEQDSIPISFMATIDDLSRKKLDQLELSFMYSHLLKEILLTTDFKQEHFTEFIVYCREVLADNEGELENVTKLEQEYHDKTPIWWYTFECFLYPMLNRALRLMDVDIIIKMDFFIVDLYRHIERLHKEQFGDHNSTKSFTVYRGQGMSKIDFEQLTKTKVELISFNNFLSTSKDREVSLDCARRALPNPDSVGILFVMKIDPSQSTTPFASIIDVDRCKDKEDEVLFAMHTVFRIRDITLMDENDRLFQMELTLTNDNDKDLCVLTDCIREETKQLTGWDQLGEILIKMSQFEKAKEFYEILLSQATNDTEKARIYHQMGNIKNDLGEYEEAIIWNEKALEILKQSFPSNHSDFAMSYNNIGLVYSGMGEYSKALSSHEKALEIQQQSLPLNHPDLAKSYYNIGMVYDDMGEYSKALSSHEKALEIQQQSLPLDDSDLAKSYNNIGLLYDEMGEYSKALLSHEKALEIRQQSLPLIHLDVAMSYNNIGLVYDNMGEYSKALMSHEKALEIKQQSLPSDHPDVAMSYNNIGIVYRKIGEYSKALSSHEKALEIKQQSLPPDHPDVAMSYNNIGLLYYDMGEYSRALSSYEKDLEIRKQSLPPNHSDLAKSYNNIGSVYDDMGEYSKALSSYEKALEIQEQSLPPDHPDVAMSYNNIGVVYYNMGEYSRALLSHEKALEIKQQSLPPNHPDLAMSYNNIGNVYSGIGEYSKALSSNEKALEIRKQSLPLNDRDLAMSYNNIGVVYDNMGNYSQACSFYQHAVDIGQKTLPPNHPTLTQRQKNLDRVKKL